MAAAKDTKHNVAGQIVQAIVGNVETGGRGNGKK
jgi:hypothetical protein